MIKNEELIKNKGTTLAKIIRYKVWPENLHFYSEEKEYVQVSTWNYQKGKHLKAHAHKLYKRTTDRTCEVIYVKKGKMKAFFFTEEGVLVETKIIYKGDLVIIYQGGHSYDILTDKTEILEVKNGPYPGLKKDKKIIET